MSLRKDIDRKVGASIPLRFWFPKGGTKEAEIITGHVFSMDIQAGTHVVPGVLYEGDSGVYFTVPDAVKDNAADYPYIVTYELPNSGGGDVCKYGTLTYKITIE